MRQYLQISGVLIASIVVSGQSSWASPDLQCLAPSSSFAEQKVTDGKKKSHAKDSAAGAPVLAPVDQLPLDLTRLEAALGELDLMHIDYLMRVESCVPAGTGGVGYRTRAKDYARLFIYLQSFAGPLANKRLMEIGPGSAAFILCMRDLGLHIDGLEYKSELVQLANQEGIDIKQGSLLQIPEPFFTEPYDITFSRLVLDSIFTPANVRRYANKSNTLEALSPFAKMTKPGGISVHDIGVTEPWWSNWQLTPRDFEEIGFTLLETDIVQGERGSHRMVVFRRSPENNPALKPGPKPPTTHLFEESL